MFKYTFWLLLVIANIVVTMLTWIAAFSDNGNGCSDSLKNNLRIVLYIQLVTTVLSLVFPHPRNCNTPYGNFDVTNEDFLRCRTSFIFVMIISNPLILTFLGLDIRDSDHTQECLADHEFMGVVAMMNIIYSSFLTVFFFIVGAFNLYRLLCIIEQGYDLY